MNKLRELEKVDLEKYIDFLTVGSLKDFIDKHNLPNDAKVLIERIEDHYYENGDWGVYLKSGEHTNFNENGSPDKKTMIQYHPAWCCVKYHDEDNILFIDLHM